MVKARIILIVFLFTLSVQISKGQDQQKSIPTYCNWESPGNRNNFDVADCGIISKCTIKYYIKTGTADVNNEDQAIAQAFAAWADVTDLKFVQTNFEPEADIIFTWGSTASGAAAQTSYCETPREVTFNSKDKWVTNFFPLTTGTYNVFRIAIHEIGHALGLDHSDDVGAIMFPNPTQNNTLNSDDIAGIQSIHGRKTGPIIGMKHLCVGNTTTYVGDPITEWSSTGGIEIISAKNQDAITVKAINSTTAQLSTSACEKFTIYTASSKPSAILGLSQICGGEGYFSINPVPGATSYIWSASEPSITLLPNASGTACTVMGATKSFTLSVKAKNPCGISVASSKGITVKKISGCNGDDLAKSQVHKAPDGGSGAFEATIYPNPTSGNLNLNIEGSSNKVSVTIYNAATGVKLLTKELGGGKSVLNVSSLPRGNYIAVIADGINSVKKTFMRN